MGFTVPDFAGSSDENSKCIQHDFPRLWGGGRRQVSAICRQQQIFCRFR